MFLSNATTPVFVGCVHAKLNHLTFASVTIGCQMACLNIRPEQPRLKSIELFFSDRTNTFRFLHHGAFRKVWGTNKKYLNRPDPTLIAVKALKKLMRYELSYHKPTRCSEDHYSSIGGRKISNS